MFCTNSTTIVPNYSDAVGVQKICICTEVGLGYIYRPGEWRAQLRLGVLND